MQIHEQKALASIAHELLRITEGGGQIVGGTTAGSARDPEPSLESEIEREMNRLRRAHESMRLAAEALWKRTGVIAFPPAPPGAVDGKSIESCGSQLGNDIQQQALNAESTACSLRYLADSLAI